MKKILSVVGARPQFIKHAPMQLQLQKHFKALTLHTGQHYDENMSKVFFDELGIPKPDFTCDIAGASTQGKQTAIMITDIEAVCISEKPDALVIYGDTNSTLAAALVGAKMHIPIIHIEAGLRSFNRAMPEEVNRIVADEFSMMLFCPTASAIENLTREGIQHPHIYQCGDVMCDMIKLIEPKVSPLVQEPYYFTTIHRPYNTDDPARLQSILQALNGLGQKVIFSIHPRTLHRLNAFGIQTSDFPQVEFIAPVGYLESVAYQKYSDCVITDSGGIQKEAYILGKKCITLRSETEWVETLEHGWNTLVFDDLTEIEKALQQTPGTYQEALYGDGHAAEEITSILLKNL
jgi:UDP-GlcNAc3NAcA epimerase